ncbi:hypothetical protein Bca4012_008980 [Brassica carinata]
MLFCFSNTTKQFAEIYDRWKRTRPNHGLEESNSIILPDTDETTSQSLSVTRHLSIAAADTTTREASLAEEVVRALGESIFLEYLSHVNRDEPISR